MSLSTANAAAQLISKVMTDLNAARERAQASKDSALKLQISTLYDEVIALKEVVNRLSDENDELRRGTGKRPPELRKVGVANFYFDGEKGPYCQPCYDCNNGRLAMLTEPEDWNGGVRRHCLSCQGYFYEKPAQRTGVRPMGRKTHWME